MITKCYSLESLLWATRLGRHFAPLLLLLCMDPTTMVITILGNSFSEASSVCQIVFVNPLPEGCVRYRSVLLRWPKRTAAARPQGGRPRFVWLTCFWSELIFYLLFLTSGSGIRGAQAWESTFGLLRMNVQGCHTILAICFTCRVEDFDGFRPGAPSPFVSFYDFLR